MRLTAGTYLSNEEQNNSASLFILIVAFSVHQRLTVNAKVDKRLE